MVIQAAAIESSMTPFPASFVKIHRLNDPAMLTMAAEIQRDNRRSCQNR
jgi:hypothetical protein